MNPQLRKLLVLSLVAAFAIGVTACNTMRGVGEDTEEVGEKIQEKADKHDNRDPRP